MPLAFEVFLDLLFDLTDFLAVVFLFVEEAFALAVLPRLFFAGRLLLFRPFFAAADAFLAGRFPAAFFPVAFALFLTALTAFLTGAGAELEEAAARPAIAPRTPPTTAPTGPATLPITAPAAAPAVCFGMGGIWMFSDDEPDVSGDWDDD